MAELWARGVQTALATSAKGEELQAVFTSGGVDLGALVDKVVTGDDADASKPNPDIVLAAVGALGMSPAACVMVGDTPHDAAAALRAGVPFIGVSSGAWSADDLREAGAIDVWTSPADLLAHLDVALAANEQERPVADL